MTAIIEALMWVVFFAMFFSSGLFGWKMLLSTYERIEREKQMTLRSKEMTTQARLAAHTEGLMAHRVELEVKQLMATAEKA